MIKPTVGRVVYFHQYGVDDDSEPWAAIIAHVHSDRLVNLMVVTPQGATAMRLCVELVQEGEPPKDSAFARWMPYQIGQAARTDDLISKALGEIVALRDRLEALETVVGGMVAKASVAAGN